MAATKPWSERIPTAIADGERLVERGGDWVETERKTLESMYILTAGEVALAKALWLTWFEDAEGTDEHWFASDSPYGPNVLREYTEKIE